MNYFGTDEKMGCLIMELFYMAEVSDAGVLCCKKTCTNECESPLIVNAYEILK